MYTHPALAQCNPFHPRRHRRPPRTSSLERRRLRRASLSLARSRCRSRASGRSCSKRRFRSGVFRAAASSAAASCARRCTTPCTRSDQDENELRRRDQGGLDCECERASCLTTTSARLSSCRPTTGRITPCSLLPLRRRRRHHVPAGCTTNILGLLSDNEECEDILARATRLAAEYNKGTKKRTLEEMDPLRRCGPRTSHQSRTSRWDAAKKLKAKHDAEVKSVAASLVEER